MDASDTKYIQNDQWNAGMTMGEVMIVMAILSIIGMFVLFGAKGQIDRGHDLTRKSDLNDLRAALEQYYTDKDCYPSVDEMSNCGGADLQPYEEKVLCDPDGSSYSYTPKNGDVCTGYALCTRLRDQGDRDITRMGCDPVTGCGWAPGHNYCVTSGVTVVN